MSLDFQLHFIIYLKTLLLFIFCLHHAACGILILQPGIKPAPTALQAQSLNHWIAMEVPSYILSPVRPPF